MPQKPKNNAFGDLLGPGFNPGGSNEPRTLKAMKNTDNVILDPDRAKVKVIYLDNSVLNR